MIRGSILPVALLLALAMPLCAQEVTVYQCTEPDGSVTMQTSGPCPEGRPQRVRVIDVPPPVTLRAPYVENATAGGRTLAPLVPVLQAGADAAAADAQADEPAPEPEPPPPLFQCTRYDHTRYFHDNDEPEPHCMPLATVGIGGVPGIGAGQACERVRDDCQPVAEQALCQAWETRLRETEFRWKFTTARREAEILRAEYERLAQIHGNSTCSQPGG